MAEEKLVNAAAVRGRMMYAPCNKGTQVNEWSKQEHLKIHLTVLW
jgi:hypothetical protein